MKLFYSIIAIFLLGCAQIKYSKSIQRKLPELGTIGVFEQYFVKDVLQPKAFVSLDSPVRVKAEKVIVSKRQIFTKKDSTSKPLDSTLVTLSIVEPRSIVNQINKDKDLFLYLKNQENFKIITKTEINFPDILLHKIFSSEELFLNQSETGLLSLRLVTDGKDIGNINFSEGRTVDFHASNFCWGFNKGYKVQLIDIVEHGTGCGENGYLSYSRAEKKAQIKF